ncbi:MAG: hypoxanthine phosphoribosyltransferase [Rikenellaceae bacterium]|jgi:hypoxanthine phosphoribosyltransferase|nr:hypoxanthine phosphoribosyltransferase [Rikenellaceae bacterium]
MKQRVTLHDKTFEKFITNDRIVESIETLAGRINEDYRDKPVPIFLGVLNGAFMFMGELMKHIDFNCEISFIKLASYVGTRSGGRITELIGLKDNIEGRHIIIVEDIVDTGESIDHLMRSLTGHNPATMEVATLLFKPAAYKKELPIKYTGLSIGNDFIVGYGLDYDQLGRNLGDIYVLADE